MNKTVNPEMEAAAKEAERLYGGKVKKKKAAADGGADE